MGCIYLSGPITGTRDYIARFARAQTEAQKHWGDVINPAAVIYQLPDWLKFTTIMQIDLALLNVCDGIYMLQGWEDSAGCRMELDMAKRNGLYIAFENKNLEYESEEPT